MNDAVELRSAIDQSFGSQETVAFDEAHLTELMKALGLVGAPMEDSVRTLLRGLLSETLDDPYALRIGSWRLDVSKRAAQSAVATAILVGTIEAAGLDSIAAVVLAAIVPFMVDIDRVTVRPSDRLVLAAMRTTLETPHDRRAIWEQLPADLQREIPYLQFVDLLEHLEDAGLVRENSDGLYELPPTKRIFHGRL